MREREREPRAKGQKKRGREGKRERARDGRREG